MSRIARLGVLVAVGLMAGPAESQAQQTVEELEARLDELRPRLQNARSALDEDKRRVEQMRLERAQAEALQDTLHVGLMTIVTPTGQVETARHLFTEVWEEQYGHIVRSPGLERQTFAFQWSTPYVPLHVTGPHKQIRLSRFITESRVKEQISAAIGTSISYDLSALDTKVGNWVSAVAFGQYDAKNIYRELATTGSIATRRCMEGDVSGCTTALGLGIDDPARAYEAWYTPDERRALVGQRSHLGVRRSTAELWAQCALDGDGAACDTLMRETHDRWEPLRGTTRASLLAFALDRGGRGGWGRILADPSMSAEAALEAASGMPLNRLVEEWRAWIVSERPDVHTALLPRSGLAMLWTLFFAALAMRSTRWRLG